MLVTISKVDGFRESLLAHGLVMFLAGEGINADIAGSPELPPTLAIPAAAGETATSPAAPVKGKPGRKPGSGKVSTPPLLSKSDSAPLPAGESRRLSQRERIAEELRKNPARTCTQICQAVGLDDAQVSNMLWNMKKAGQVVKDETVSPSRWSLA